MGLFILSIPQMRIAANECQEERVAAVSVCRHGQPSCWIACVVVSDHGKRCHTEADPKCAGEYRLWERKW